MVRPLPLLVTFITLGATVLAGTTGTAEAAAQHRYEKTKYAFGSIGYGSLLSGGTVPAGSGRTAYNYIDCTNKAGLHRNNFVASAKLPGVGTVSGVRTDLWTQKAGTTYSSYSTNSIAKVVLSSSSLGTVDISGLKSLSRAYHQGGSFKASTQTKVASIVFTPTGGKPQTVDIPTPGKPVTIPGVAKIAVGSSQRSATPQGAAALANVLDIKMLATGTRVQVAQSRATIGHTVYAGRFSGYSAGLRASALANNVQVGRTPLTVMGCLGTHGAVRTNHTAEVNPAPVLDAQGVSSSQVSTSRRTVAQGTERGQVAHAAIAGGAIQIDGIVAVANVKRADGKLTSNSAGTRVGSLTVNGKSYDLAKLQTVNIPGLAKIEAGIVEHVHNGLMVTGVRVTLLNGTGGVIDLGLAKLQIRPGFRR